MIPGEDDAVDLPQESPMMDMEAAMMDQPKADDDDYRRAETTEKPDTSFADKYRKYQ